MHRRRLLPLLFAAFLVALVPHRAAADEAHDGGGGHEGMYVSVAALGTVGLGPASSNGTKGSVGFEMTGLEVAVGHSLTRDVAVALDLAGETGRTNDADAGAAYSVRLLALADVYLLPRVDLRFGAGLAGFETGYSADVELAAPSGAASIFPNAFGPTALAGVGFSVARTRKVAFVVGVDATMAWLPQSSGSYEPFAANLRVGVTSF